MRQPAGHGQAARAHSANRKKGEPGQRFRPEIRLTEPGRRIPARIPARQSADPRRGAGLLRPPVRRIAPTRRAILGRLRRRWPQVRQAPRHASRCRRASPAQHRAGRRAAMRQRAAAVPIAMPMRRHTRLRACWHGIQRHHPRSAGRAQDDGGALPARHRRRGAKRRRRHQRLKNQQRHRQPRHPAPGGGGQAQKRNRRVLAHGARELTTPARGPATSI